MAAPVQVVPQGIQSVNGSSTDMGCTSALVDSGDVMTCNSQSYLVDGCSPDIDTSISDWASQLVTVRRVEGTADIPFAHVLLSFGFDTAVSLTGIEIDLFHCPDWGIGAPRIRVYLNDEYDSTFSTSLPFLIVVVPSESRCDSLSNFTIPETSDISYHVFHILITSLYHSNIEWVYVGEVTFLGSSDTGTFLGTCMEAMSTTVLSSSHSTSISHSNTHKESHIGSYTADSPTVKGMFCMCWPH